MMTEEYSMTINGEAVKGAEYFEVTNPATASPFSRAPNCSQEELGWAVKAARDAFHGWRDTSLDERRSMLSAFAGKIAENAEALAQLLTLEQGKPVPDAKEDIFGGVHWLLEVPKIELPAAVTEVSEERKSITLHEPIGVVAGLVPWNFPIALAMMKVAQALVTGNTMVLKPAPTTPLTTLKIGEIAWAIFPPGVLNVISGADRLGPWLTSHQGIDKISFTGSSPTGKRVMASAADGLKRVTLELGGNDSTIVLPDVDIEVVVEDYSC